MAGTTRRIVYGALALAGFVGALEFLDIERLKLFSWMWAAEVTDLNITDASNTDRFPEGMAPGDVNDAARALEGILARWEKDINGTLDSGGSSSAYTLTPNRTVSAYSDGQLFVFEANHTNSGAATLNVSSLGAKDIRKNGADALVAGNIKSGQKIIVVFDGPSDLFQLVSSAGDLKSSNNLADVASTAQAYANLVTSTVNTRGDMMAISSTSVPGRIAVGSANTVLKSDGTDPSFGALVVADLPNGTITQIATATTSAVNTGTTLMPADDTIPQITEGDEYITVTITPASATSTLIIQGVIFLANSSANDIAVALFQDSTAGALAAVIENGLGAGGVAPVTITHVMTAGTTSATTFRIRAGTNSSGTITLNGLSGSRLFGGVAATSLTVKEIKG